MFEAIAFYLFAALTIVMFTITVMTSQALYAITAMAAGMIFISAFFFILGADFLGAIQIIVYTGAVMALYAFGMMFFDTTRDVVEKRTNPQIVFVLGILAAVMVVAIFVAPIVSNNIQALYPIQEGVGNSQAVGMVLFTKYLVPFELAAVMLLVAMIGGIILAGKKMDKSLTLMAEEEITTMDDSFEPQAGGH
ncbi:MAG: NADH:ubiquinone oxidoreductase subunit J [Sulfuricurvum sp. GWF2_44_89]|uniref:NADH-quinone oxidoreductase subunit J n=1 Tax=Sulfuricurvum kujiense TaxID=148813 RepID=A0A2D3WLQ5_9BACT|nr:MULTISPECIES: NADH-quinone oxidoreductase subunit J [Sulfuricurvum]OHD78180.1 MAG: NADH:ubiquinone oxidoreductase subunit J [Sulfuricurvum sp. GWF2_44_89]OHD91399.1 MAG: NADH:ubiquinone oxidoreductase subunit J [Sulfuricurvum sp. RIFOXYD12_FULL_44_77]OHD92140.1 MAG: NADH:ubiquinone oxidoreductase subunit J [Sulfuricurvum sp. RIFOXYD2_FULL_44_160]DAB38644.1 MAG TPA: NADH:ubiquinone oxidoreductase subunit J [Sulfuricurvum kujiense]